MCNQTDLLFELNYFLSTENNTENTKYVSIIIIALIFSKIVKNKLNFDMYNVQ